MSAVRTRGLGIDFGGGAGLHDVDLDVPERGVTALIGPNGAGKTTLFAILTGLVPARRGTVETAGRVAFCPDAPEHEPWLTGAEVVAQSRALVGLPRDDGAVREVLARCGLTEVAGRRVGAWSRGMTQRLGIAATIATQAPVLILDEPTSALDPFGQADVLTLVRRLGQEHAVILSSHSLADVERAADRVAILHRGHLLWQGTLPELLTRRLRPTWELRTPTEQAASSAVLALQARGVVVDRTGPTTVRLVYADVETGLRSLAGDLAAAGAPVLACTMTSADLDAAFVALVDAHDRQAVTA